MLAALASAVASLLGTSAAYYIAMKAVLITLMMVVLPILLKKFFTWIIAGVLTLVTGSALGSASSTVVALTGVAGFLGSSLGIPAAMAVIVAAVATRFTLKLIPFLRVG